mgnify:CR=1 FL=1
MTSTSKRVGMIKHRNRAQYMSPLMRRASAAPMLDVKYDKTNLVEIRKALA